MQLVSIKAVRKKLKSDFASCIKGRRLRLFTHYSGFVAEISNENIGEYFVNAFLQVDLKVIQIEKTIEIINIIFDENPSITVEINSCLSVEGRGNENVRGYLLYQQNIDSHTSTVLRNNKGYIFPVLLNDFLNHYELDSGKISLNENNIFFSIDEVNCLVKEIREERLNQFKKERNINLDKVTNKRRTPKSIGIEYAKDLWAENSKLSKNQVSQKVHDYIKSLNFKKVTKPKSIATTWLIPKNIPNMPEHTSCLGSKKSN